MVKQRHTSLIAALLWAAAGPLHAQSVPALLPVQGSLADGSGASIDAEVSLTFKLYAAETDDSPLYEETQSVSVDEGRFTAYVGEVTALDLGLLRDNPGIWIGVAIEDGEELPRFALATVPYAAMAQYCADATSLGGAPAGDYALASDVAAAVDPTLVQTRIAGQCTSGQFMTGVNQDGSLVCAAETGSGTGYNAGSGLALDGASNTFSIAPDGVGSAMVADGSLTSADLASDAAGPAQMAPATGGEAFAINFGGQWDAIDTFSATPYKTPSGTAVCMMAVNVRVENDTLDGGLVGAVPIFKVSGAVAVETAGGLAWTDVATSLTNNNTVVTSVGMAKLLPDTNYDFGCRIRIPMDVADNSARCHLQYVCF